MATATLVPPPAPLQFNPAEAEMLSDLFQDARKQPKKKSFGKRLRKFFVPNKFELRPIDEVVTDKLLMKSAPVPLDLKDPLKPEEEAFVRSAVKAFFAEPNLDQEARKVWRDLMPEIIKNRELLRAQDAENIENGDGIKRAPKETLSEKKKKDLYNWIRARLEERAELDKTDVQDSVTLEDMVERLNLKYAFSKEVHKQAAAAKAAILDDETLKVTAKVKAKMAEEAYIEVLRVEAKKRKTLEDARYQEILEAVFKSVNALLRDDVQSKEIEKATVFKVDTIGKRIRYFLGWVFSLIFSLGCGVTTAGAFLIVMSGGAMLPLFIAILVAGFLINYAFSRKNTPETIAYTFSGLDMFKNMFKDLTTKEKVGKAFLLGAAILAACATGFAAGVLTYTGAAAIVGFFALSAFPPALFAVLAFISAVCIATVMIRGIVEALEGNATKKVKEFFTSFAKKRMVKIYDKDGIIVGERPESTLGRAIRMGITIFLFVAFFAFAVIGCVFNQYSAHMSIVSMFNSLHQAVLNVCTGISAAIVSLSVLGELQLHFDTAKAAAKTLVNPFIKFYQEAKLIANNKMYSNPKKVAIIVLASLLFIPILLINMFGNGMVAGMGSSGSAALTFSAVVAALESFIDTFRDYVEFMGEKIGEWARALSRLPKWLAGIKDAFVSAGAKSPDVVAAPAVPPAPGGGDGGNDSGPDADARKTAALLLAVAAIQPPPPASAPAAALQEATPVEKTSDAVLPPQAPVQPPLQPVPRGNNASVGVALGAMGLFKQRPAHGTTAVGGGYYSWVAEQAEQEQPVALSTRATAAA